MTIANIIAILASVASLFDKLANLFQSKKDFDAGKKAAENVELSKSSGDVSESASVENSVSHMSDASVSDELREYTRD